MKGADVMRIEQSFDKWMLTDKDGFYSDIDPNAPEEVKEAYKKYKEEQEKAAKSGFIPK